MHVSAVIRVDLVMIYLINDLPHSILSFKFNLFTDDSTITSSFRDYNRDTVQNKLNEELEKVHHWLE